MKAARLLKLFEYFNSDSINPGSDHKRSSQKNSPQESVKRTVRFINRKMVIPIMLLLQCLIFANATASLNDDACTVGVIATATTIVHPGCQEGTITLTPQTAEVYAYEIHPMYDLSLIQESSAMNRTGTSVTATYHMAGDYAVYITTLSGCTGIGYVTINQPPCPTISPVISVTNASLNGATNGAVQFNFNGGNSCGAGWVYTLTSALTGTSFGTIADPVPSPGVMNVSISDLWPGTYTLGICPGGNMNYPSACVTTNNFTISQPACDLAATQSVIQPLANSCNSGQINLEITGQTLNDYYVVELYKNSTLAGTYYATELNGAGSLTISSLEEGNYAIRIYNGTSTGSCYTDISFEIAEPACNMAIAAFSSINSIAQACNSGSAEATINGTSCNGYYVAELTLDGSPYANYYPAEISGTGTITMSGLMAGNYVLNVTNGNACTQTQNFTISEPACNIAISSLSSTNLSGFGCNDGTLDLAFTGATCNNYYSVTLTKDGTLFSNYYPAETAGAGLLSLNLLPSGNYTIEVTNGNAICSATQNFTITEPSCNIVIANFVTNNPTINIGNNGGVIFNAQGSNCGGNYYYEIYNGGSLQTSGYVAVTGSSSPASVSGLVAGSYELKLYTAYGSTCVATQTFTLSDAACNVAISSLTANNISSGCGNGAITFNASGNTAYGYYTLLIEKDGSYYNAVNITPTGATTAVAINDLLAGAYTLTLSDGAPTPCTAQQSTNITETTCDVLIVNPVLTEISITGNNDGAVTGTMSGATCSGTYLVKLFDSGNFVASQVVTTANPAFEFHNLFSGLYQIQAFSGENVGNTCFNEYGFLLIDPCPVGNISVSLDTSLAPCDVVVMTAHVSDATDPSTAYYFQYRVDGGPWLPHSSFYGSPGGQTVVWSIGVDGHYELRSGPLVVLNMCSASTGFNVHKNYCDAYSTSATTLPASNNCSNGKFTLNIVDPHRCSYQTYVGYIFSGSDTVANLPVTAVSGNNVTAVANLPAGNYSYTFYTIGTYLTGLTNPKCPITGSFTIADEGCNLTFSDEVISNGCSGTDYSVKVNGRTCFGQFLVQLYKDGNLISSNSIIEYTTVGFIGFGLLDAGNYTVKVYADHLSPAPACYAERSFTVSPVSCDLSITNLVVNNAAADLSYFGSVSFNVSGTECYGYQVTIMKDGFAYFSNNVTPTGAFTPQSFSSLPPDDYQIVFSNGLCEVSQLFTVTQGNLSCNLSYTNLTLTNVTTNGGSNGTINFTLNGNTCGSGQYEIEVYRNSILLQSANYTATGSSTTIGLTNLPAGNIQVLVYNGCMSGINECAITFATLITEPAACNLAVSVTNQTNPSFGCANGSLTINMSGNANGNNYVLNITSLGAPVYYYEYSSSNNVSDVITNLAGGVYDINLSYAGSGACVSNTSYTLNANACNLSIADVVTTQACELYANGAVAFDVNGTICQTSSLQLLSNTGSVLVNTTINASDSRVFENLAVGNYSIQVTTPGGCSINYPFTIDPICTINLYNETVTLEGAGSCTTGKLSYYVNSDYCSASLVKLINNTDMTVFYQSNIPNIDGIDANTIENIPVGNYTLQVLNNSGSCSESYNFNIAPAACSNVQFSNVTLGVSTAGCAWAFGYDLNLGNCPGSVLTLSKDGSLIETYNLVSSVSTEINSLTLGNYNLHLTTPSGCTIDYPFVVNPVCDMTVTTTIMSAACDDLSNGWVGFPVNGTICDNTLVELINSSGAVVATQFIDHPATYSFADMHNGSYTIQLSNAAGCSASTAFNLSPNCELEITNENIILEGSGSCTTGKLTYHLTGNPCSASIIKLINNVDMSVIYQSNAPGLDGLDEFEINNLPVGNYTLQLTNISGSCVDNYNFIIAPAPCSNVQLSNVTLGVSTAGCAWAFGYDLNLGNCPGSVLTLSEDGSLLNTYNLNTSVSTEINYLTIGNYNLHLVTGSGCVIDYPFVVNPICDLAVNYPILTQTNDNLNSGAIAFNLTGEICNNTPLQLLSSTGAVLATQNIYQGGNYTFGNLNVGDYSVQVTNAVGCSVNYPFTIDAFCDINLFNETLSLEGSGSCTTGKISYYVTATVVNTLIVKLTNTNDMSVFYQSNVPNWDGIDANEISNIPVGNYTLEILNSSGNCSDLYNVVVAPAPCSNVQFSNVTITPSQTDGCYANFGFDLNLGNCPGSVLQLFYEGTIYSTANINQSISTETTNLAAGNYNYHLTTGSGCVVDYPFTINPPVCNISINNITPVSNMCAYGSVSFNVTGNVCSALNYVYVINNAYPTTPLFYDTWVNGIAMNIPDLPPGNYTIVASNQISTTVNCTATQNFTIENIIPTCNIAINNITPVNNICASGSVSFNVTGNNACSAPNLVYVINNAYPTTPLFYDTWVSGNAINIPDLPPGNYTIVAANQTSATEFCDDTAYFTIEVITPACNIAINNITPVNNICASGSVSFNVTGNNACSAPNLVYVINNAYPTTPLFYDTWVSGNAINIPDLPPGNYTIVAANQISATEFCDDTAYFTIEVITPACNIAINNITPVNTLCTDGSVSFNVTGNNACSAPNLVYVINNAYPTTPLFNDIWMSGNAINIPDLPQGNYTIVAANQTSATEYCADTAYFSIQPAPCNLLIENIVVSPIACSALSNVSFNVSGSTCNPANLIVHRISEPAGEVLNTTWANGSNPNFSVNDLATGNYTVQLYDALNNCSYNTSFTINANTCDIAILNSNISSTGVLTCVHGRIDFDVTGTTCGTGVVAVVQNGNILTTLNWTTGNGAGLHFDNLSVGNYSLVAVNNLFNVTCGDTLNFTIDPVHPPLTISNINVSSTGVSTCTNGTVTFNVNGQFCGTSGVVVYNEANAIVYTALYNNSANQSHTVSGLVPGNYFIDFGVLGYQVTESFTIAANPCNISINNVQVNYVSGSDGCTVANVSYNPTGYMCSNGSSFLWLDGNPIDFHLWAMNTSPTFVFNNLSPGNYMITAGSGTYGYCTSSYNFTIVPQACTLNIASVTSTPSNGNNGTINVNGAGNYCGVVSFALDAEISIGNYSNLTTNNGTINTQFAGLAPGNYRVTISSAGSTCQDVEYITVSGAPCNTTPVISSNGTTICPGQSLILNSNYLTGNAWSNGGTSFNTTVTTTGTYTLTVTELNGCSATTSVTITAATNCVPATQMNNGVCGTLNFVRTSSITCVAVSGATQYEWQFSNNLGVFATKTTATNYVLLHSVTPALNWGTNWNVKVRAKIGANSGPYSADCAIGIMPDPTTNGVPLTQLRTQDCNKLNYRLNADNRIIANPIAGAIQYEFEFSSSITGLVVATKLMPNNVLFLNTVTPALTFPAQYNVRVRARIGNVWGVYGTPCLIGITGLNREEDNASAQAEIRMDATELASYFELLVMPNPFNEQATLVLNSGKDETINVEVYDLVGNLVWKERVQSNTNVNFGLEFAQGTYIVKAVNSAGNPVISRFIKSK